MRSPQELTMPRLPVALCTYERDRPFFRQQPDRRLCA